MLIYIKIDQKNGNISIENDTYINHDSIVVNNVKEENDIQIIELAFNMSAIEQQVLDRLTPKDPNNGNNNQ